MDGVVGRGTLLAGRYRLFQPIASDLDGAAAWAANDQILDRPVRVAILSQGHVPQALDAARRAALVTDPRLVRVLDVGDLDGIAYLVTEPVTGPSLAQLVARGPMPADQARAIIGEAAAALEAARRRGVHHLALRPSVLHLTSDNHVLLTGLAVDGALLGKGLGDARSTTRADTVGLVALLYAALTGRWPGANFAADQSEGPNVTRLPAAPVLGGVPVAPTELVAGIPNDLDTLCAVTLGSHDDGPHSPAELVLELEPWGNIQAVDLLAAIESPRSMPTRQVRAAPADRQAHPAAEPDKPAETAVHAAPTGPPTVRRTSVRTVFTEQRDASVGRPGTPPPATPARASAFGTAAAVAPSAAVAASAAVAPSAASAPARPLATPPPRAFDQVVAARGTIVAKRFDPTRLVLGIVIITVLIVVYVAFQALTRPATTPKPGAGAMIRPSATATAQATPAPTQASPAPSAPAPAASAPAIASGEALDPPPQGDNNEHPDAASLAVDGDPATSWFTRTYSSPAFGGLKPGVGYAINLAAPATVTTITLQVNGAGGMVEVRSTDPSTPTTGAVLAQGPLSSSTVLALSAPAQTQHLVLWFTALPQTTDGSNRLELAEVKVS